MRNDLIFRKWHNETELKGCTLWIYLNELEKYGIDRKDCKIWRGTTTPIAREKNNSIPSDPYFTITRKIEWKKTAKPHKCGAKCRGAKGHQCECECGGANHGKG